jgi:hypothetical protein
MAGLAQGKPGHDGFTDIQPATNSQRYNGVANSSGNRNFVLQSFLPPIGGGAL